MPLPSTVTSACPDAADSALTGTSRPVSRSETSVPGAAGSANGRTNSGTFRPMMGISARGMQHLGAVVRQLGGFAHVELRHHPGVGHDPRIGGQQPRHVLPQRDALGSQRPTQQGRGEIGATPSESGDLAARRRADESRDDGDDSLGEQRLEGALDRPVGRLRGRERRCRSVRRSAPGPTAST